MAEPQETAMTDYESALRASEARFRNLIEKNADGIVVVSRDGFIRYLNPAAESLLGCEAKCCLDTPFGIPLVLEERAELDLPRSTTPGAVAEMRVVESEWEGEPAYLASLRDITDRKQTENLLRQSQQALREADRRKDEFLATLAHELRNPLAPVRHALQILRLAKGDKALEKQAHEVMERQMEQMARLIDDLLDVSRITNGKIELRKEATDLATVLNLALESSRPHLDQSHQKLTLTLPDERINLQADPVRLGQVFTNLLNNAAKYTRRGGDVHVRAERLDSEAVVTIQDSGVGIAPDKLTQIFDLFVQVDRSRGGLGIGLSVARQLLQMHGGSINVHSDGLDKGSTFTVRLPVAEIPAEAPAAGRDNLPTAPPSGLRILLVEDNPDGAHMLTSLLQLMGHEVRTAYDGEEGIEAAAAFRPEVVLLDIGLPKMDGYTVARRLRQQSWGQSIRLIALTGWGQEEDRRRSREAGFDEHWVKPLNPATLEQKLRQKKVRSEE